MSADARGQVLAINAFFDRPLNKLSHPMRAA